MNEHEVQVDPRAVVRQFRKTYVNAHALRKVAPMALPGADLRTPQERPITEANLPQGLRALLADYRNAHPRARVTLLKYQRIENGKAISIVEDEAGLPDEDKLLSLSQTVTLTTSTEVRVITEIVVASVETA
jgi:hypothetical protein